ncbi:MAG: hypothetical protein CML24_02055 [Rhizobiales bacterium]|nr:hypothetical protein [Hyphomicrobiales bacterium]|tara:strand:- start:132 stop:368 length:237 start_codon:yes stop_codon:yes gene_type:complete
MTEDEYRREMQALQGMLEGINDSIDVVAGRLRNGAVLSYPGEYKNSELFEIHEKLTARVDAILDKMQDLHKAFNHPAP